jgi:WbqC-like protein family
VVDDPAVQEAQIAVAIENLANEVALEWPISVAMLGGVYGESVDRSGPAVALMQPTFLPWAGYFALIDASDVFVFLDDFQFRRRSWHHRNRLFAAPGEAAWLTVPAAHTGSDKRASINEVAPVLDWGFRKTFRGMVQQAYSRSDHLQELMPPLNRWIEADWASLADLNIAFIELALRLLGIQTGTLRSSEMGSTGHRSARLADLLSRLGARRYLAAAGSREYMTEDGVFPLTEIETYFQDYQPAPYPQVGTDRFVPYLSVLDLLLQVGPDRALGVIRAGSRPFCPWNDERP